MSRSSAEFTFCESQTTVEPLLTSISYADWRPTFDSHAKRGEESIPSGFDVPLTFNWLGAAFAAAGAARARTSATAVMPARGPTLQARDRARPRAALASRRANA